MNCNSIYLIYKVFYLYIFYNNTLNIILLLTDFQFRVGIQFFKYIYFATVYLIMCSISISIQKSRLAYLEIICYRKNSFQKQTNTPFEIYNLDSSAQSNISTNTICIKISYECILKLDRCF